MLRLVTLAVLTLAALSGQDKKKTPKPPDLEILEVTATRDGGTIIVDGRVKNTGIKSLEKVVIIVDFFAPNKKPMVSKKGPVETELLEPGEETDFKLAMLDPGQLVAVELQAIDKRERDLRLSRSGPFSID